jgi:hypothetical protein
MLAAMQPLAQRSARSAMQASTQHKDLQHARLAAATLTAAAAQQHAAAVQAMQWQSQATLRVSAAMVMKQYLAPALQPGTSHANPAQELTTQRMAC